MTKRLFSLLILVAFITTATTAQGKELVKKFTGSRSTETVEFEVRAPWLLDWWVNGEYPQAVGLEVSLVLFDQSGTFRLKVDATMANWVLKVEQLTREEAEQYTPVDKTDL
jgi:hypothetical protein